MMSKISLYKIKALFLNVTVIFTILIGIESILIGYNHQLRIFNDIGNYYGFINPKILQIHRTLSVIIGFVLIFISYRLFKRMRMAWIISVCMVAILFLMNMLKIGHIFKPAAIVQLAVLIALLINYQNFKRVSDPISLRNGIILGITVLAITILNIGFAVVILRTRAVREKNMYNVIADTLKMLFLIDPTALGKMTRVENAFVRSEILINWTGIIAALFFILKPLVFQPIVTVLDREKVRKLLKEYGDNPVSYVAIEDDKKYYFGKDIEGFIAYISAAGVAVCVGDPVCSEENLPLLLSEFIIYCRQNDLDICFCSTLEKYIPLYTQFGFGYTKCGEEAMFNFETYNLAGGKAAKIRNAINHATALGVKVTEYKPLEQRDRQIEQQIHDISRQWLEDKKSSELSFMLGTISLDNPMDRRYFAAYDEEDRMLGFIVFSPFARGQGYYADVTRRKSDAPIGVMEKITIEAFNKMRSEGVKLGSLGLAPLVNIEENSKFISKVLEFIYEKLNNFYGFKTLYHYKKKYGCSTWESRYFVYYPKNFTPKIAYSIIKAHNPKGVSDFILVQLKSMFTNK